MKKLVNKNHIEDNFETDLSTCPICWRWHEIRKKDDRRFARYCKRHKRFSRIAQELLNT